MRAVLVYCDTEVERYQTMSNEVNGYQIPTEQGQTMLNTWLIGQINPSKGGVSSVDRQNQDSPRPNDPRQVGDHHQVHHHRHHQCDDHHNHRYGHRHHHGRDQDHT